MEVARPAPQGGHYLLDVTFLTGNVRGSVEFMVLRERHKLTQFPTNIHYTPVDNMPLHPRAIV